MRWCPPIFAATLVCGAVASGVRAPGQTGPPAGEIFTSAELDYAEGRTLYGQRCNRCHGPDGDWIDGLDIADPQTLAQTDADELVRIIIAGVPDTPMAPSGLNAFEAGTVAAYLRFVSADRITTADGNDTRGRELVEGRAGCLACHPINGEGPLAGPDLGHIGAERRSAAIRDSILDPNAEVRTENRYVDAHLNSGDVIRGRLLNQDSFSVQLLSSEGRLRAIPKTDLEHLEFIASPMPSFESRLTRSELNDIVRYLATLR